MHPHEKHSDLFITTLHELHSKAPLELLSSLREHLEHIRQSNPNSAQTAEACLAGLWSNDCTLLHVLTAAYLINGGVMLKHGMGDEFHEKTLTELEEELLSFGINEDPETLYEGIPLRPQPTSSLPVPASPSQASPSPAAQTSRSASSEPRPASFPAPSEGRERAP